MSLLRYSSVDQRGYSQMKDMMNLYSNLVERCFNSCTTDFSSKALSGKEEDCTKHCADKFLAMSNRVGLRFSERMSLSLAKRDDELMSLEENADMMAKASHFLFSLPPID